jgi:hypothetical protein
MCLVFGWGAKYMSEQELPLSKEELPPLHPNEEPFFAGDHSQDGAQPGHDESAESVDTSQESDSIKRREELARKTGSITVPKQTARPPS